MALYLSYRLWRFEGRVDQLNGVLGQVGSKLAPEGGPSLCYENLQKSSPIEPVVPKCSQACLGSGISTSSLQNDGLLKVCSQIHNVQDCVSFALRVLDLQTVSTYGMIKLCIEVGG